ncbi:hypothetical protein AMES_2562 [Amycolatopsis mediterranei S699]|uniref:Uncharacterized protein n=2 Tax=Amycolatopsis mediterranei TaxID=33910 RepID=A0A0H3D0F7_AMYMU|nr:hypothetical protein [Amycolatopsis mediterranei]ADJ44384.1 hypothetical protein AMED_2589 [Amycolatopsis mediterranei U32]AEK41121.1 hypothetical protein RAM_13155 [Amycolatopsis mediterranei S699]AFO76098.1 hypothetical protein AMES_2562 [Amycolatopsis mediterranei S699]AGT83227.1 hypothetical protein B737_2563 [Amycolatopsis mediterranei RB]KDO06699.1 hypothetical protein DV26_31375 [Amycolatopsis mediterranei]
MTSGIDGGQLDLSGVRWLPGGARLAAVAQAELPQKDGLAAAFCGLAALRAAGLDVPDQDAVAAAAGTVRGPAVRPPGEPGRHDFRLPLPVVDDPAAAGTRVSRLAAAVGSLSRGALVAVPVTGEWTTETLFDLLVGLWDVPRVAVLARIDGAELGAHDTPHRALLDYLDTGVPPLWTSRWRPPGGHFVLLAGIRIGAEGTLLSIVDTYPALGDHGRHDQPVEWVTAALAGLGVLVVVDAGQAGVVRAAARTAGLSPSFWD